MRTIATKIFSYFHQEVLLDTIVMNANKYSVMLLNSFLLSFRIPFKIIVFAKIEISITYIFNRNLPKDERKYLSVKKMIEKDIKDEWKGRLKTWGIILLIWIIIMIIFIEIIATKGTMQNIEWNLYTDFKMVGYTIGVSIACWSLNYIIDAWSNRNKESYEKRKSITVYSWIFFGVMMYISTPFLVGVLKPI